MPSYLYPSSIELKEIEQILLPVMQADDILFKLFPAVEDDAAVVAWEQMDKFVGLQNVRGIGGQPGRVSRVGVKRFQMQPGQYSDVIAIDEQEITQRRQTGTLGTPVDISDLVYKLQQQLLQRRIDRQRWMISTLLTTGVFTSTDSMGNIIHTDSYTFNSYSAGTPWATYATATPLLNIRTACTTAKVGQSVRFDATAKMLMNQNTVNDLLSNSNSADLGGKRRDMGSTFNSLKDLNVLLAANDLPEIVPYHEAWSTDGTNYNLFIPNNKVVVVGARKNDAIVGEVAQTRNATNPNAEPGPYTLVVDSMDRGMEVVPRKIEVHDGWNGGIKIFYPGAIITMTV